MTLLHTHARTFLKKEKKEPLPPPPLSSPSSLVGEMGAETESWVCKKKKKRERLANRCAASSIVYSWLAIRYGRGRAGGGRGWSLTVLQVLYEHGSEAPSRLPTALSSSLPSSLPPSFSLCSRERFNNSASELEAGRL